MSGDYDDDYYEEEWGEGSGGDDGAQAHAAPGHKEYTPPAVKSGGLRAKVPRTTHSHTCTPMHTRTYMHTLTQIHTHNFPHQNCPFRSL
jgi:hypothetical protein